MCVSMYVRIFPTGLLSRVTGTKDGVQIGNWICQPPTGHNYD
jgi:hypothetical protein